MAEPSAASRAELQRVVADALGGVDVILADDALTQSSVLIVERRVHRDPQGNRLPGRDLGKPEKFKLFLTDGTCLLVQQSTGQRWALSQANCVPE